MQFQLDKCILRPWQMSDANSLAMYANNRKIADNLRDEFPYPYTLHDARTWLEFALGGNQNLLFAIEVDSKAVGGIGLIHKTDVYRKSAEIGYWLGEPYWYKGIMTESINFLVKHTFAHTEIIRIYAGVFENNIASARVLTKCGFKLESVHHQAIIKNGKIMNELIYSNLK
ncbi:MAG: GNAT family N-acetyltransferase [Bacteroidetes bacterium HGW-Bacteroidetes-17]|nr:MAG: GNAT family N-acetyltransferase [Bacteroidetes bacterium HGW-Bacteroidetes-17]